LNGAFDSNNDLKMSSEEDDIDVKVREKSSDEDNKDENEKEKKIIIKKTNVDPTVGFICKRFKFVVDESIEFK